MSVDEPKNQELHSLRSKLKDIGNSLLKPFVSNDFSHIDRPKTRFQLICISAAVMGIEFCYAADTAFVSPILLRLGVNHVHMTLVWCLSPIIGFFLTPVLGSMSDKCELTIGRRRPFIFLFSIGIILGLILVPNGEVIGIALGDERLVENFSYFDNVSNFALEEIDTNISSEFNIHCESHAAHFGPWGLFFTVMGIVLLDFDSDACQSPSRAYMLDITIPEDHARGLSTFTIMAGMGGACGYALGGINWNETVIGYFFGGHIRAVFTLILVIFVVCVTVTLCSFREMPLSVITKDENKLGRYELFSNEDEDDESLPRRKYGSMSCSVSAPTISIEKINETIVSETSFIRRENTVSDSELKRRTSLASSEVTLRQYLESILRMPKELRILCVTNLFSWMAHVCYSLYFTDFVGEAIFKGDPQASQGSLARSSYEEGVRFGCWGMSAYSLSCSMYSLIIEKLITRFGARPVYIGGQLVYSVGMICMAIARDRTAAIVFSCSAGVMYSTLFTMPYLLVAHYHANNLIPGMGHAPLVRGLGTDVAIVSSMVFVAQFILSACMGTLVSLVQSTVAVVCSAAFLSFCGAVSATQIYYSTL